VHEPATQTRQLYCYRLTLPKYEPDIHKFLRIVNLWNRILGFISSTQNILLMLVPIVIQVLIGQRIAVRNESVTREVLFFFF
jgi:hypothetical protein